MPPVPASEMLSGEFEASLTTLMLPVALPAPGGAKVALKLVLCPAAKVMGRERPLRLNPLPVGVA